MYSITRTWTFEAAHHLVGVPPGHKCSAVHGHSYTVTATVEGQLADAGWVLDYAVMDLAWANVRGLLDHQNLNLTLNVNPTAENLAAWLFHRLGLPGLVSVTVSETSRSSATFQPSRDVMLLSTKEAAVMIGVHHMTLKRWRAGGGGPRFVRLPGSGSSGCRVRYLESDLRAWVSQLARNKSESAGTRRPLEGT